METNENLDDIQPFCFDDIEKFSDETLNQFFTKIDEIPHIIANSKESFLNKLTTLKKIGLFITINLILDSQISTTMQIKMLKFWDFLFSTSSSSEELDILFSDGIINKLIFYSFDVSSIEILQSYMTVLKGISLKAKFIDPKKLFTISILSQDTEKKNEINQCPLYSQSVKYINHSDSVVVSAARFVVLSLCLIKYSPLQAYLSESSMLVPFDQLISNIGPDEFAFLVDFLNVAPLNLREYVIHKLRIKFSKCSLQLLCYGASFLKDSPARPMLIDTLSERIFSFSVSDTLLLGLLLFSLENKLILLNSAIKFGLITHPDIATFSKKPIPFPDTINFRNEVKLVLEEPLRASIPIISFSLALRCLEMIYSTPPHIVIESNASIINEVKLIDPNRLVQILLAPPPVSRRVDIKYLLEHQDEPENIDEDEKKVFQLFEIQVSIHRWRKMNRFTWFSLSFDQGNEIEAETEIENKNFSKTEEEVESEVPNFDLSTKEILIKNGSAKFPTSDGNYVSLSPSELILPNNRSFKTSSIYIEKKKGIKLKKFVDIMTVDQIKRSKSNLVPSNGSNPYLQHVEFASANVANSFESELANIQKKLIDKMIQGLET